MSTTNDSLRIIAFCVIIILNTAGVIGNLLVLISFIQNKRMRIVRNYYLVCLASIDLSIGIFSVPLYLHTLLGYDWPYGFTMCLLFTSIDAWLSSASCLCGVAITYDRFSMVKDALSYIHRHTPKRAVFVSSLMCMIALLLRVPVSFYGGMTLGTVEDVCGEGSKYEVPYSHGARTFDIVYTISSSVIDFLIPVIIIMFCNIVVFCYIRKHQRRLSVSRQHKNSSCYSTSGACGSDEVSSSAVPSALVRFNSHTKKHSKHSKSNRHFSTYENESYTRRSSIMENTLETTNKIYPLATPVSEETLHSANARLKKSSESMTRAQLEDMKYFEQGRSRKRMFSQGLQNIAVIVSNAKHIRRRESKAFLTMILIIVLFILFRGFFIVSTVVNVLCDGCVNPHLYSASYWWFWLKSAVNPFLYAFISSEFRQFCLQVVKTKACMCRTYM